MKVQNKLILRLFVLTAVIAVLLFMAWAEVLPLPFLGHTVTAWLAILFPCIPFFLLQYFLCGSFRSRTVKAVPAICFALLILWCLFKYLTATGWDVLSWSIALQLCLVPAVGCLAALLVTWLGARRKAVKKG